MCSYEVTVSCVMYCTCFTHHALEPGTPCNLLQLDCWLNSCICLCPPTEHKKSVADEKRWFNIKYYGISLQASLGTDLCWGYTEQLSSLQDLQAVNLWQRTSIFQPGQSGSRDTCSLTMKLQDIINNYRYFCCYTRALYVWRIWQRK